MLSLNQLLKEQGKSIADVDGYWTVEFGDDNPVFKLCWLLLSDGTRLSIEGEHNLPYLLDFEKDKE